MKKSLSSWVKEVRRNSGDNDVEQISQANKSALKPLLNKSKNVSQALKRKIIGAKEKLTDEEKIEFCKLDFKLRVSKGLNSIIDHCCKGSN